MFFKYLECNIICYINLNFFVFPYNLQLMTNDLQLMTYDFERLMSNDLE